jgi:hypothetical protein
MALPLLLQEPSGAVLEGAEMKEELSRYRREEGAIGYILLWLMGVPASVLFLVFLVRGCT